MISSGEKSVLKPGYCLAVNISLPKSSIKTNVVTVDCLTFVLRTEFGSRESSSSDKQLLTIYDLDNKFIAYSASFDDVIDVVAEWGSFYILTRDGKMLVLQEKDTQTKLEVRWYHL